MELERAIAIARARHNGILVAEKADGRPHLSNISYAIDGDGVVRISTTAATAKAKHLARSPKASLYVGREDFWAFVVLDGDVELSAVAAERDDAAVEELIDLFRAVQGEHPDWDDYRRAMVEDRRLVIRLRPTHAYGQWPEA
jgi:PPOX class probable F420-dependent enzyme